MTQSTIKEVEEEPAGQKYLKHLPPQQPVEATNDVADIKTDQDELLANEPIEIEKFEKYPEPAEKVTPEEPAKVEIEGQDNFSHIDVKVPKPGAVEYDRIQDQNQAIKKLIISIDNIIKTNDSDPLKIEEMGGIEQCIRNEIENEDLLSENEKKTIEVLVIDYLRNEKSVLDLIRLDKLEEDLRSHDDVDDGKEHTVVDSEDRKNVDILWKLPESEQYEELLTQTVPNKYERINEIKYKIPNKWTKQFNVDDIVPHREKLQSAIIDEGGMVNNYLKLKKKILNKKNRTKKTATEKLSETVQNQAFEARVAESREQQLSSQEAQIAPKVHKVDPVIPNPAEKAQNVILTEDDIKSSARYNETDGFNDMQKKPIFTNQDGVMNVPLSNMMLKESLSSKQDSPKNNTVTEGAFPKPGMAKDAKTLLQRQKDHTPMGGYDPNLGQKVQIDDQKEGKMGNQTMNQAHLSQHISEHEDNANVTDHEIILEKNKQMGFEYDQQPESPRTEAQFADPTKADEMSELAQNLDFSNIKPQYKPEKYNIDEIEHLFMEGKIPGEIHNIEDPMEYNYLLVKLKKEFNDKTRSEFLKYMNLQLPYNSRRDEVGGVISEDDWQDFILRVGKMIRKVRRKRRRVVRRRKKQGKRLMPRKTLFKPKKRPNLAKDSLWKEIFMNDGSDDSTVEDTDVFEDDNFKIVEPKPKKKFFENNEKFELPSLYKPLVKETKKPIKHE